MLKKQLLFPLILLSFVSHAQRVYWASEVLDFSSELSAYEYSAEQVLGKPNALPQGGDSPNAWMPAKPNKLEFISVAFEKAIRVQQIVIAESYNPSAVYEIYLYNKNGNEFLVHTFEPRPVDIKSRLLRINIEKTKYQVESLRVIVDGRKVPGYSGIDAIGVSGSNKPIEIKIEQPQNLVEEIVVERLSNNVNSPYQETRPLIAPDGKTIYYSRAHHPENIGGADDENDIWYSELDNSNGTWKKAVNIGPPLNNKGPNYISSITPDGNAMTVLLGNQYGKRDKMKPGVSVSTKTSEGWSKPQPLDIINGFIESMDGNYFLATNRKVLIMAVDRYDAYGGKDLYVSFLQRDNRWTEPLNLGNDINTAHTESSPYLAADNETLYFSSKGFSGYGGSDVYISRRLDDTWTNWTEPENLGPDINSAGDDVFFNIPPSGQFAYYSKAEEEGNGDIYKIAMPIFYQPAPIVSISGKVLDASSHAPVVAKISYNLLPENTGVGFTVSDSLTGEYEILLPAGSAYDYKTEAVGYVSESDRIDLVDEVDFVEIERTISLSKGEDAQPVAAVISGPEDNRLESFVSGEEEELILDSSVLFEFASDFINKTAHPMLDKLVEFMKEKPSIELLISGHTDNVGPAQYNISLSKRRAESVLDYFVSHGISDARFQVEGHGSERPIASNDTSEGQSKNRRVEFSIKKNDSN
ncbi:MAG: OmpA family protein [Cytophagales bacterium]|nr:OmpA family protein [Cytophagales bacterium]